jgi:hypothetical protein
VQRRRAHQTGVVWRDPLAADTDAIVAGWRASREALPAGERHLAALLDSALEAYGVRLHPGESIFREPGASRFRTWLARVGDVWERALEFLDTFGFVEDVRTPWVALHHAHGFDERAPHDTAHCGLCLVKSDPTRANSPDRVVPERVRFGPLPRDVVPFCVAERIELLSTYSCPPDRPGWQFAPMARSIAGGGLDHNELLFEAGVTGALEHVGLVPVLQENRVRFTITPRADEDATEALRDHVDRESDRAAEAPVGEAGRVREALRAQLRGEVYRWVVRTGREPTQEEWSKLADWPSEQLVTAAYGSFEELVEDCELHCGELVRRTRQLEREHEHARGVSERVKRRLEAVAARERELAGAEASRAELERAAGEARVLRERLEAFQQRLERAEADRPRDAEPASGDPSGAGPSVGSRMAAPANAIAPGLPLYRLWLRFDPGVGAERLLGTVAAWIDPDAAQRLLAARGCGAEIELADGSLATVDRLDGDGDWIWQARWRRAHERVRDGRFEFRAVVGARGPERHLGLEVSVVRPGAPLAPTSSLGFRAPELAALLLDAHRVADAAWPLRTHALELRDRADAEELAQFLYSKERQRPVVHCSARRRGPSVDAHRLARELAGLAHVTYANDDGRVDDALKAQLPGRLGAWGGAVRVYYPGLAKDVEHRYISAEEVGRHGEGPIRGRLLRDLAQLACATMAEPDAVADVRRALAAHVQSPTPEGQEPADESTNREPDGQLAELLDEHERTLRELEHAREKNERLRGELEQTQRLSEQQARQIAELSHNVASHAGPDTNGASNGNGDQPDRNGTTPRTAVEAVKVAMRDAKHLVYAPRAVESAKDCPYQRPEQILDALRRLDQLAQGYLNPNGIGCGLDERARQLGLRWRGGLQDGLIARYPNHYTITYRDRRWTLGPHVALGGGDGGDRLARIYLVAHPGDQQSDRALIVGHVGRHLPDNTTG